MFHKTNRSVLAVSFLLTACSAPDSTTEVAVSEASNRHLGEQSETTVVIMPTKTAQHCLGICTYILATHLMPRLTALGQLLKMPIAMLAEKRFLFSPLTIKGLLLAAPK